MKYILLIIIGIIGILKWQYSLKLQSESISELFFPKVYLSRNWKEGRSVCIIKKRKTYCAGDLNNFISLENGSTPDSSKLVLINSMDAPVDDMCILSDALCAVTSPTGSLKCWGNSIRGTIKDGTKNHQTNPKTFLKYNVSAVSCNSSHFCAIVNSGLQCWGDNSFGQFGNGTTTSSNFPIAIKGLQSRVTSVSVGLNYTCVIKNNNAYCFGQNTKGELGDGTTVNRLSPVLVQGLGGIVTKIETNYGNYNSKGNSTCAIVDKGLKCWGNNDSYQLGDGTKTDRSIPTSVTSLNSGVTDVSLSGDGGCAIQNKKVKCWGGNNNGTLGNGTTSDSSIPVSLNSSESFVKISHGGSSVCGVSEKKEIWCWGLTKFGKFGMGNTGPELSPSLEFQF